jgi:hypothetical protein
MNIADILFWEATNGLLLIPVWIALVMFTRWMRGRPAFTERDWLFLIGHPREKILSLHFWLRLAALWFTVVLIGVAEIYGLLPYSLASFLSAVVLAALTVLFFAPKRG